jgi:hypothetical protein
MAHYVNCECIEDLEVEDVRQKINSGHSKMSAFGHQGPSRSPIWTTKDPYTIFSCYGMMVQKLTNPLDMVIKDYPVTLVAYAQKHILLNEYGWKKLKTIA